MKCDKRVPQRGQVPVRYVVDWSHKPYLALELRAGKRSVRGVSVCARACVCACVNACVRVRVRLMCYLVLDLTAGSLPTLLPLSWARRPPGPPRNAARVRAPGARRGGSAEAASRRPRPRRRCSGRADL
jgi:hypothetical protein